MNALSLLLSLEQADDVHLGRLLVLLDAFAGEKGDGEVAGITKLVKLDFLLRYPEVLERSLSRRRGNPSDAEVKDHERRSVESRMVRYKFGPWDPRYYRFINLLSTKGLVRVTRDGKTVCFSLTEAGRAVASELRVAEAYKDVARRSKLLRRHFNLSATNLMHFVYDMMPELETMALGEEIR